MTSSDAPNGAAHISITLTQTDGDGAVPVATQPLSLSKPGPGSSLKRLQSNSALLRSIDQSNRVSINFEDVCAWVPTLVLPGGGSPAMSRLFKPCLGGDPKGKGASDGKQQRQSQQPEERQVLFNISGAVHPGEVLALMGPSGGGKSSLLAVLGGRSTARVSGTIAFNGRTMDKQVKRKLGYVMQDDLLFAELTTYETLYFAALLRLPRSWSRADKLARVEMVLAGLGLERCRDTIIGNHMMRGVSGGERKRVSIGHELLINPSMLLLDEPTSGLDSTTALRLMHTLRSLASGGRTIVTSIHQPSSRLYKQMDKLMLLSEGHVMYYGDAKSVVTWFDRLGQPCPFGTNIADHILDLANGDVVVGNGRYASSMRAPNGQLPTDAEAAEDDEQDQDDDDRQDDKAVVVGGGGAMSYTVRSLSMAALGGRTTQEVHRALVSAYEERVIGRGLNGILASELEDDTATTNGNGHHESDQLRPSTDRRRSGAGAKLALHAQQQQQHVAFKEQGKEVAADQEAAGHHKDSDDKWGATWVDQVRYLTLRSLKTRRFQSLSVQTFAQVLAVAVLAGMFWWQIGADLDSVQRVLDVGGLLFFIQLFMAFASLYAALFTFPTEFQMLVKERQSGMYRLSAYYVARTASDLPLDCLLPSLFTWILYWMAGLRLSAGAFFCTWFSVVLIVLTAQSMGLLIGANVINPKNGQTIATIFMLSTMLVGGYYVRGIPVWISWLKYVSFIYWGWNLLLKIEFRFRGFACSLIDQPWAQTASYCSVNQAAIFDINLHEPVTKEVCILFAMLIFLRLCVYYSLQYKTTFKNKQ